MMIYSVSLTSLRSVLFAILTGDDSSKLNFSFVDFHGIRNIAIKYYLFLLCLFLQHKV